MINKKLTEILIVGALIAAVCATFAAGCAKSVSAAENNNNAKEENKNVKVETVLDRVVDLGTFTTLDRKAVNDALKKKYDLWESGCTAVATQVKNGDVLVGRNLDLYISDKPAFVVKTAVPGNYKTVGVGYTNMTGGSFEEIQKNGIPEEIYKILPYYCNDVLNEKGLYCEINMRNGEYYPNGDIKFGCDGTNKDSKERVCATIIPRLVCEHCTTVEEAVKYLDTLDIYTPNKKGLDWNFCYILADATGDYGLVEIAENKISFLDKQHAQTNFYVTKEFADKEEYKCGVGRYDTVMNGIGKVRNELDMYNLMNKVTYFQAYFPDECQYDYRTENVGVKPYWTTDYVLDDKNKKEIDEEVNATSDTLKKMTRKEIEAENYYWETVITTITNCNDKTMTIRFFEDDSRVYELEF